VRFDHTPLFGFGQVLEVLLLKNRLIESLFYLHSQPPLFNGFLGIILKTFPGFEPLAFASIYHLFGFVFYLILYKIMRELEVRESLAFIISTIFIISPSAILYENWLFYTFPVAFLTLSSSLALLLFIKKNNFKYSLLFFSLLALLALLRQTFHPVYVLAIAAVMFFYLKNARRNIVLGSIFPICVIFALLIKNFIIFGTLTSSWFGMNFANITIKYIPDDKKISLVREGKLDKISLIIPFWNPPGYYDITKPHKPFGIPVLDIEETSTKNINFNNYDYINISRLYFVESVKAIKYAPEYYLKNVAAAFYLYFRSPSDYRYFYNENRNKIDWYDRIFNTCVYFQTGVYTPLTNPEKIGVKFNGIRPILFKYVGVFSIFLLPGLLIFTMIYLKRNFSDLRPSTKIVLLYLIINILLVTLMGNLIEVGENNRFRYEIEPLFYVLAGFLVEVLLSKKSKIN